MQTRGTRHDRTFSRPAWGYRTDAAAGSMTIRADALYALYRMFRKHAGRSIPMLMPGRLWILALGRSLRASMADWAAPVPEDLGLTLAARSDGC
jgi:hypothetical protein